MAIVGHPRSNGDEDVSPCVSRDVDFSSVTCPPAGPCSANRSLSYRDRINLANDSFDKLCDYEMLWLSTRTVSCPSNVVYHPVFDYLLGDCHSAATFPPPTQSRRI